MGVKWRKENPNPRVHRSSGKLGEPRFPLERVDPRVGIFLSPLDTHGGFYLSLSYYLLENFNILWPKRLRAESTHPENWPKRPTYQGRNDPPPKLAETTQAETTQAETTQGRNDPDSYR